MEVTVESALAHVEIVKNDILLLGKALQAKDDIIYKKDEDFQNLLARISELEGHLEDKNGQVDDLNSKLSDMESENEGLKAKLADMDAKLKEADEEKKELLDKMSKMKVDSSSSSDEE